VDKAGHLVGIVSQGDVLSIFSRPDEEIRREVTDLVTLPNFLMDPKDLEVTVEDGIVTLSGRPPTGQIGRDVIEAVRHIEGIVAVRDQLGPADEDNRLHRATP